MRGYYRDREATAAVTRDGWFWTGDRGSLDPDGFLFFRDRLRDVIRRRGENVSADEVEQAVLAHPAVSDVAVIGAPSDVPGGEEDVAMFVVPVEGTEVAAEELIEWCRPRVADFMLPRYIEFLDALPRTETLRVRRADLRELSLEDAFDRSSPARRVDVSKP
jgi:carnitine-CoA ligase